MTRYGYARISDGDPDPGTQEAPLGDAWCERVFTDHGAPGAGDDRPGQAACLAACQPGDTLTVTSLDRLGLTARDQVSLIAGLAARQVTVEVLFLELVISPGDDMARLLAAILAADREVSAERARGGTLTRPARGRGGGGARPGSGRKPSLTNRQKANIRAAHDGGATVPELARKYQRSQNTINRVLGKMARR